MRSAMLSDDDRHDRDDGRCRQDHAADFPRARCSLRLVRNYAKTHGVELASSAQQISTREAAHPPPHPLAAQPTMIAAGSIEGRGSRLPGAARNISARADRRASLGRSPQRESAPHGDGRGRAMGLEARRVAGCVMSRGPSFDTVRTCC